MILCSSSAVYLNVTNIETFNVGHDKFCIKWTPHRAATSYRIKLNPADRESPPLPSCFIPFNLKDPSEVITLPHR